MMYVESDDFGPITSKSSWVIPPPTDALRRYEMGKLLRFFQPMDRLRPRCAICGSLQIEEQLK